MTPRRFAESFLLLGALSSVGCAKAEKADCEKMVDRMTDLELEGQPPLVASTTRAMMEETKRDIVAECAGKESKRQVQCVIDAKTKADVDNCK